MKRLLLFLFLIFFVIAENYCQPNREIRISGIGTSQFFQPEETNVIGSPYLSNNFMLGNLIAENDTVKALFRYNVFNQLMEIIYKDDTLNITSPFKLKEINFSNRKFIYCCAIETKSNNQLLNSNYYEVITDGYCQLLLKRVKKLDENAYVRNYMGGGGDGRAMYSTIESHYIRINRGEAVKLNKNKKGVLSVLSDKELEIESFIEKEKIQFNKIDDIAKIIDYYNSLIN
ncbi:MAG: hypothetical protein K9J13_12795 [Saprospiraceae bacterium]|nr:hypothetical protein [Saprospiraceae bacterium]